MRLSFFLITFFFYFPIYAQEDFTPYLLGNSHPMRGAMEKIFADPAGTFQEWHSFKKAGFEKVRLKKEGRLLIARHPLLKGYLIKTYLNSRDRETCQANAETLRNRVIGAAIIKNLITRYRIQHFTVADKWLYELPHSSPEMPLFVLLVKDMNICSRSECRAAWKTKVTPQHLQELFRIVKGGCASTGLVKNVPYTKEKKFAFIDTEYLGRTFVLEDFKPYLSLEMQDFWDTLIVNSQP